MDNTDFEAAKIRELLEINREALTDLMANNGSEEAIAMVRDRCHRYGQVLNQISGPLAGENRKARNFFSW